MPKKSAKRKSRKPQIWGLIIKWLFFCSVVLAGGLLVFAVHLDRTVRTQFEGKRFSLPARVYARPLELFVGKHLLEAHLQRELSLLGFAQVERVAGPGEYTRQNGDWILQNRPFEFWGGLQESQRVRVRVVRDQIHSLQDDVTGLPLDLFRLEPISIGGIYTDKHQDRELVRYHQVPRHLIDALIAVEDQRFYLHKGVDFRAVVRAAVSTVTGKGVQGGSTITQQLVKNFFLTPERTLRRKFTEMLMALLLELRYEKNDILETYINEVYFGQEGSRAIHGVGLASQFYFGRSIDQLKPHHSALLVAMLKGPTLYNPRRNPERALQRRNLVLAQTFAQGYLFEEEYRAAQNQPLDVIRSSGMGLSHHPAFLDLVFRQLRRDYREADLRNEGLRIFTTLDPVVQSVAERVIAESLSQLEQQHKLAPGWLEAAAVFSVPQTGEITALIGSRHPGFEGFNRALDARRPVGSLFKPAIYLTALEQPTRYTLSTLLDDSELQFQEAGMASLWQPRNFNQRFHGDVPLWQALAQSYNVSSARLGLDLGVNSVINTARRLGIESPLNPYASTFLGASELPPIELAQMYQTLAAGGFHVPLRAIREVLTMEGRPLRRYGIEVQQVAEPGPVYLLIRALQIAVEEGTARSLSQYLPQAKRLQIAAKTGTTDGYRDSWFAGFSGDHVAVVWLGNDQNQATGLSGATGALPVWGRIMAELQPLPLQLPKPESAQLIATHRTLGAEVRGQCAQALSLPFLKGSGPDAEVTCDGRPLRARSRSWWRNVLQ